MGIDGGERGEVYMEWRLMVSEMGEPTAVLRSWAMKREAIAIVAGGVFVGVAKLVGHNLTTGPTVALLLWPGLTLGALAPDSGYSPEGDLHPWGLISRLIVYGVNIALYAGLAYLLLGLVPRLRRELK